MRSCKRTSLFIISSVCITTDDNSVSNWYQDKVFMKASLKICDIECECTAQVIVFNLSKKSMLSNLLRWQLSVLYCSIPLTYNDIWVVYRRLCTNFFPSQCPFLGCPTCAGKVCLYPLFKTAFPLFFYLPLLFPLISPYNTFKCLCDFPH